MIERNNLDYLAIQEMIPFEFKLFKMTFIEKQNRREQAANKRNNSGSPFG